jgi:endonuclease VIII
MPEGDTVYRTAAKLREALEGSTLTRCDVRIPKFATVDLTGEKVDEVLSRGKHLFIRVGEASIHSHLKMDGAWLVGGQIRRVPAHKVRIILETSDIRVAGVDLGVLEILERRFDEDAVAHLGPDLLGADWEPRIAAANLATDPDRPLADTLLDHLPTAPVSAVRDPLRMVQRARDMLWLNRSRVNRTTTGDTRPGRDLWVYGRGGRECRRCGTMIESDRGGDRVSFWCPVCQT